MKKILLPSTAATAAAVVFMATISAAGKSGQTEIPSTTFVTESGIAVATPGGIVNVTPLGYGIFRIDALPGPSPAMPADIPALPRPGRAIAPDAETDTDFHVAAFPGHVVVSDTSSSLTIDRQTGKISFYDADGRLLASEAPGIDNSSDIKTIRLTAPAGGNFSGTGERGHSTRLNGDTLVMFNRQNYGYTDKDPRISQMGITTPYFVSDKGYGVLFDDHNRATLLLGDTITYTSDTPLPLAYYFINGGKNLADATKSYTRLTGRQPLPPFWTLGYITSRYGYHNEAETRGAVDSLKTRGYPVDGIVLDLYWYGVETDMGRLEWDTVKFPDHRKMLADLKAEGVNTVLITQPYINKKGAIDNYKYLSSRQMLARDSNGDTHDVTTWVGDAGMLDVSNPQTREWLWQRLKRLTDEGVAGWWGDLGEPEVHPNSILHANGQTAEQYHNVYGNDWSELIFNGLRSDFPELRPMLMMRGGTAGLQRYGVFPWTTDVSRSWGGLRPQVKLMINSGLSGLGYMSSDLGGFAVDPKEPTDPELYVRWLEMGVFTPMMRTHAQLKPEPYNYPEHKDITLDLIRSRYRWLPYNYTLAYENASQGLPLARPLNFRGDNPEPAYAAADDEYLWGDNVLVAPVFRKGARSRSVLFPAGEWVDWHSPLRRHKGGTTATVASPLGKMPLFVRAGSFIPQYDQPIGNVTQYNPQILTLKYFPAEEETEYVLFDDNRLSPSSIEDNAFQLTFFTGSCDDGLLQISARTNGGSYEGMPQSRLLTFEIPGLSRKPQHVAASDGTPLPETASAKLIRQSGWNWNQSTRTLTVRLLWNYDPLTIHADL